MGRKTGRGWRVEDRGWRVEDGGVRKGKEVNKVCAIKPDIAVRNGASFLREPLGNGTKKPSLESSHPGARMLGYF